jgi:hypothetical protein
MRDFIPSQQSWKVPHQITFLPLDVGVSNVGTTTVFVVLVDSPEKATGGGAYVAWRIFRPPFTREMGM